MTVGADRPVNSCILESPRATATCKEVHKNQPQELVRWTLANKKIDEMGIIQEEQVHLENLFQFLMDPSHIAQCRV
jgi:hypothetical protein